MSTGLSQRYKTVFVAATFVKLYEVQAVQVPTGEVKRGLFGIGEKLVIRTERRRVEIGVSDSEIDGAALAESVESAVSSLAAEGYQVVSVTSVVSGAYRFSAISSSPRVTRETEQIEGGGYGYGYSFTSGVLVLAHTDAPQETSPQ